VLEVPENQPAEQTSTFGDLFETFLVNEVRKLNSYEDKNFKLSYYSTKNDVEVDLVLSKGRNNYLVEIKSSLVIDEREVRSLSRLSEDFPNLKKVYYVSRCKKAQEIDGVSCLHWQAFLKEFMSLA
jgi:predicted AAA+ superfamily ATPase